MNISKHNPKYKLVSELVYMDGKYIELVYGISNDGNNEGLEAYFYTVSDYSKNFYRSYRWIKNIPKKYMDKFNYLKSHIESVPDGYKLKL